MDKCRVLLHRVGRILVTSGLLYFTSDTLAKDWKLELGNDSNSTVTTTVTWTFNNNNFITGNPAPTVSAPEERDTFTPANGQVFDDAVGAVVTRFPNDWQAHNVFKNGKINDIKGAVGELNPGGNPRNEDIRDFLDHTPLGPGCCLIPIPSQVGDLTTPLYTGVNLGTYLLNPVTSSPGVLSVVNGSASELPGYVISLVPVTFDPNTGLYTSSAPFSGNVQFDAHFVLEAVPEPTILALFGIGLALTGLFVGRCRRY